MRSRRSSGSYATLIECRSTMQKNASPCSCVGRVLAEAARVVAEVLRARRLDAGEDAHRGIVPGPAARGVELDVDCRSMRIEPVPPSTGTSPCRRQVDLAPRGADRRRLRGRDARLRLRPLRRHRGDDRRSARARRRGRRGGRRRAHACAASGCAACARREPDRLRQRGHAHAPARGLLAGQEGGFELVGDESLSARPMERIAEPLRRMGATVETTDGPRAARHRGRRCVRSTTSFRSPRRR